MSRGQWILPLLFGVMLLTGVGCSKSDDTKSGDPQSSGRGIQRKASNKSLPPIPQVRPPA